MPRRELLPGTFRGSDSPRVNRKTVTRAGFSAEWTFPKIVNWVFSSVARAAFSGVIDSKTSGRLATRFPGERHKTSVILLRS